MPLWSFFQPLALLDLSWAVHFCLLAGLQPPRRFFCMKCTVLSCCQDLSACFCSYAKLSRQFYIPTEILLYAFAPAFDLLSLLRTLHFSCLVSLCSGVPLVLPSVSLALWLLHRFISAIRLLAAPLAACYWVIGTDAICATFWLLFPLMTAAAAADAVYCTGIMNSSCSWALTLNWRDDKGCRVEAGRLDGGTG